MKFYGKLKIIKQITGLTQEKLADKLGVSFVTLNSWINNRSTPRQNHQKLIDDLYLKSTGQKIIPQSELQAKKQIVISKSNKYKSVLDHILKNKDIYDELMLQVTYNTNSIEGSTLTQAETAAILFNNKSLPNKTLVEQLEAKNHHTAFKFLLDWLKKDESINEKLILKLHSILMNGIIDNAGVYRNHSVRIVGVNVPTTNYVKITEQMNNLIRELNKKTGDVILKTTLTHSKFEQIHPFSDGNGRVGRLLIQAMLLKQNIAPAIIKQEERGIYLKFLNKSQIEDDQTPLEDFLCNAILLGLSLINRG